MMSGRWCPRGRVSGLKSDFLIAITQVCAERRLPKEVVLDAIEQALILAYKRNFGTTQNISVKIDPNTGKARVYAEKEVVEEVQDERTQISLDDARKIDATAEIGGTVKVELTPKNFGRIAAQTAKQVILQRIREAERETLYADWSDRAGEVVMGTIRNIDASGNVILSLGRAEAIMPRSERIPTEVYTPNQRLRTYIYEVEKTNRGPRIKVSRTHHKLLRRLLESEVPEIYQGTVEIKGIAREPGSRSKVAVAATQEGVDPVGSCVGMRGVRIQNIVNELNGEKIDIVAWAPDEAKFIANALSPARVNHVWLDPDTKTATVVVPDNQLSLAIGKEGQNARLAAKLTNWRIDIKSASEAAEEIQRRAEEEAAAAAREAELAAKRKAAAALLAEAEKALAQEEQAELATSEESAQAVETEAAEETVETEPGTAEVEAAAEQPAPEEEKAEAITTEALPEEETALETTEPWTEGSDQASEQAVEQPLESETSTEEVEVWDIEEEDEEEEEIVAKKKKGKRKRRPRDLVYDEESGIVISRPRRKPGRRRREWEEELDELDW